MELSLFFFSFLIPAIVGAAILALGWLLPPVRKVNWLRTSMFGVALGVGLVGSFYAESGMPVFPPPKSDVWIGWLAIFAIPVSIAVALTGKREFPWVELCALILGLVIAFLPYIAWREDAGDYPKPLFPGMSGGHHGMLAILIAFGCIVMARLQEVRPGATIPVALAIVYTACSISALASGWITMGILFGVIAAISGAGALIGRFAGKPAIGRGGAFAAVLFLTVLPTATWCKTSPPDDFRWWFWAILAGTPLLLLPCENRVFAKMPATAAFWIRVVIVAIPAVFILILVIPMLTGGSSGGEDEFDDMMQMFK